MLCQVVAFFLALRNTNAAVASYLFKRREQLDADKTQFVASYVFEQEGIVLQVFIRQVVLYLGDQFLDEFRVRGLPALLLEFSSAGSCSAVCREQQTPSALFHILKKKKKKTHCHHVSLLVTQSNRDACSASRRAQPVCSGNAPVPDCGTSVTLPRHHSDLSI